MINLDHVRKALALPVRLLGWVLIVLGFAGNSLAGALADIANWIEGHP
ncbi:hypothetical protein [Lichenihabitans psoromatis]|nr:hypothetical protein [Lichenihabitans psoromatis]